MKKITGSMADADISRSACSKNENYFDQLLNLIYQLDLKVKRLSDRLKNIEDARPATREKLVADFGLCD